MSERIGLNIDVQFQKQQEVAKNLQTILDYAKKNTSFEIDLDAKNVNKSLGDMGKVLSQLKTQLSNFGVLDSVVNTTKVNESTLAINKETQALKERKKIVEDIKMIKTATTSIINKNGEESITKELEVVQDEYGKIIQTVDKYSAKTGELKSTVVTVTDEIEKQRLAQEKLNDELAKQINKESEARAKSREKNDNTSRSKEEKLKKQIEYNEIISLGNKELEERKKLEKLESNIDKFKNISQPKLDIARNNNLIDNSVIAELQSKLNSINTNTASNEMVELKKDIDRLSSSDNGIVRVTNEINKLQNNLNKTKGKYGDLVGGKDTINELKQVETQLLKLKSIQRDMENGTYIDGKKLSSEINQGTDAIRRLETATKNSNDSLKLATKDASTFGDAFRDIATKVGLVSVAYTAMNKVTDSFRFGMTTVVAMDDALTDLNKVVDMSKTGLDSMKDSAIEMGKNLSKSSIEVAKAQAEFGRLYKDAETINKMTEASIIGSNVMDNTTSEEVAKGLTTVMTAMKLETTDAMMILDSMNEVQNNYRISADGMLEAMAKVGSTAIVAGLSIQELEGYITAMTVATGKSGDEVGNSIKSLTARIYKIGSEGIEAQGKPEEMLRSMGVAVRDAGGEFLELDTILDSLNIQWKNMSETEKIATSQVVAGQHKYNDFIALMNNYDMALNATETALDSMGSASAENEIYLESISARMESLKVTSEEFWLNFINSDAVKGSITILQSLMEGLIGLENTFGGISLSVGILSSAFLMFTNNPLKAFAKGLVEGNGASTTLGKSLTSLNTTFTTTKSSMGGLRAVSATASAGFKMLGASALSAQVKVVALQVAMSFGLSLAISAVVTGLTKMCDWLVTTKKEAKEMSEALNESITTTSKTVTDAEATLAKMEEIETALANTSNMEEKAKLQKELNNLQVQMGQLLPGAVTGLNDEGLAYASNNGLIKQQIDLKKDKIKLDAIEMASSNTNIKTQIDSLNRLKDTNEKIKLSESQGKDTYREKRMTSDGYGNPMKEVEVDVKISEKAKRKANDEMTALAEELSQKVNAVEVLRSMGETDSSISSILGVDVAVLDQYVASLNNAIPPQSEVSNGIDEIGYSAETTVNQIKGLTDTFNGLSGDISLLEQALADFSTNGALSIELRDKLLTSGDSNLIALLGDENAFLERGNQLLGEKRTLEQQTTDEMINLAMADVNAQAEAEITKMNNSNLSATQRANNEAGTVDNNAINYGIDANNNIIAENDKLNASVNNSNQRGNMEAGLVDSNSKNYSTDESNYSIFENSKLMGLDGITQRRALLEASLVGSNLGAYTTDESNYGISLNGKLAKTQSFVNQNNAMMNELMLGQSSGGTQKDPKNPYLSAMKSAPKGNTGVGYYGVGSGSAGGSGYSPVQTYKPSGGGGGAGGSLSGSKPSGSSSSSAKEQEKDIANLEKLSDRYYDLDNELQKVENSLSSLHIEMENADDETRIKLLKQEIGLLNKQQQALENIRKEKDKDRIERKTELYKNGFEFNSDGSSKNSQSRLDYLTSQANSKTGESKEKAIKEVERLAKLMKEYDELLLKDIPKITDEISDMKNEVISAEKEIEDIIKKKHEELADIAKKQRDDYIKGLEKETDKLKSELEKRKKIMNDTWKNDDFGDDLSEKQATLNSLEEQLTQAMRTGDEELIRSIRQQITEAQKEVDNFIRDNERDKANERFDKEQEKLDKDLQNKVDEIILKLSDEEILKMVKSGVTDLTKVMDDITKSTMAMPTIITKIGTIIQDQWIGGLSTFMAGLESIQKFGMNMNFSPKGVNFEGVGSKSVIVNAGGLTIQGNVTEDVLPDLNRMLERNNKQLLKEIQNTLEDR